MTSLLARYHLHPGRITGCDGRTPRNRDDLRRLLCVPPGTVQHHRRARQLWHTVEILPRTCSLPSLLIVRASQSSMVCACLASLYPVLPTNELFFMPRQRSEDARSRVTGLRMTSCRLRSSIGLAEDHDTLPVRFDGAAEWTPC